MRNGKYQHSRMLDTGSRAINGRFTCLSGIHELAGITGPGANNVGCLLIAYTFERNLTAGSIAPILKALDQTLIECGLIALHIGSRNDTNFQRHSASRPSSKASTANIIQIVGDCGGATRYGALR